MCSFYGAVFRYYGLFYMIPLFLSAFHRGHCEAWFQQFHWTRKNSFTQSTAAEPTQKCQNFDQNKLLKKLKDEGYYNPTYMASTKEDAANFPDLADKHLIRAAEESVCDADCKLKTTSFLQLIKENGKYPSEEKVYVPDMSNKEEAKRLSPSILNIAMFSSQPRFNNHRTPYFNSASGRGWDGFNSALGRRSKRQAYNRFKPKNDLGNIGTSMPLYCWKEGEEDENEIGLIRLCRACKSIREMPKQYFPIYLNEVRCDGTSCLGDQGACVQKYVTLDILKNNGTDECQNWVPVSISISVCCDCQLKAESTLMVLLKQKI